MFEGQFKCLSIVSNPLYREKAETGAGGGCVLTVLGQGAVCNFQTRVCLALELVLKHAFKKLMISLVLPFKDGQLQFVLSKDYIFPYFILCF